MHRIHTAVIESLPSHSQSLANKRHLRALLYRLNDMDFATDVSQVQEIVRPTRMARPTKFLGDVDGFIKRRGRLVPIVDLRRKLGLVVQAPTSHTCAVIVGLPVGPVGFMVDAALDLQWVRLSDIAAPDLVWSKIEQRYLLGLAAIEKRLLVILDLMKVLSDSEQQAISGATDHV